MKISSFEEQHLILTTTGLEACVLSVTGSLLSQIGRVEMQGNRITWWLGEDYALLLVPAMLLDAFARYDATTPYDEQLQAIVAQFLMTNPNLRVSLTASRH